MVSAWQLVEPALSGVRDAPASLAEARMTQAEIYVAMVQPPECHAISRAAGDVLYTPEQVLPLILHAAAMAAYRTECAVFG